MHVGVAHAGRRHPDHDLAGRRAVEHAITGEYPHGTLVLTRAAGEDYQITYEIAELERVAGGTKVLEDAHLEGSSDISQAFRDYAMPLVGELPRPGRLEAFAVDKRLAR